MLMQEEGGCVARDRPCPLYLVKQRWVEAGLPIQEDKVVREKMRRLLGVFKKEMKSVSKVTMEKKAELVANWQGQTFNIAVKDWKRQVNADRLTSRAVHKSKIAVVEDYIVFPATR